MAGPASGPCTLTDGRKAVIGQAALNLNRLHLPVAVCKTAQDLSCMFGIAQVGGGDQVISFIRGEISLVAVDVDPKFKHAAIGLGMKLGGVYIVPVADHLEWTGIRRYKMGATFRQVLNGFLVANKGVE